MKKTIFLAIMLCFVLAGCGKKNTLKCTYVKDNTNYETELSFKGKEVSEVKTTTTYETEAEASETYTMLSVGQTDTIKVEQKGKTLTITLTGDSISKSIKELVGRDSVREYYIALGYMCK